MKKKVEKTFGGDQPSNAWAKRMASMFREVQKQKAYARHNPPMEKRTTRFICRLGRGAHAFDSVVSERLPVKAVPLFWQLAFIEAVKAILSSDDSVTISHLDAVMERGAVLMSDNVLFSRGHLSFVKTLLPKVVAALTDSYEAFRTDALRFDRNARYAHNEYNYPLAAYGFRRAASVLALSVRRKEMTSVRLGAE